MLAEWGTGSSSKICDVTMKQQVDRRLYDWSTIELRDNGYFYVGGENTTVTLTYLSQVRDAHLSSRVLYTLFYASLKIKHCLGYGLM